MAERVLFAALDVVTAAVKVAVMLGASPQQVEAITQDAFLERWTPDAEKA